MINYNLETIEQQEQIEELNSNSFLILSYEGTSYKFTLQQLKDWIALYDENQKTGFGTFIGNICMMINREVPAGYLLCNGNNTTLEQLNNNTPNWVENVSLLYPELDAAFKKNIVQYYSWDEAKTEYLQTITGGRQFGGWLKPIWDQELDRFIPPLIPENFYIAKAGTSSSFLGAGLPNIQGKIFGDGNNNVKIGLISNNSANISGSFYPGEKTSNRLTQYSVESAGGYQISFDASKSSPYYNSSIIPRTDTTKFMFVICVSTMTSEETSNDLWARKTELINEITRAKVAERNLKVNIDDINSILALQQQGQIFQDENALIEWLNIASNRVGLKIGWNFLFKDENISHSYQWMGEWDGTLDSLKKIAGGVNLSGYYNAEQTDDLLNDKVDKIEGMGLSQNNFTDVYKAKIDSMVTQVDLSNLKTLLLNALNNKLDADKVNPYMNVVNQNKEDETLSVAGIKQYVDNGLLTKLDKVFTFTKTSNIKDVVQHEDISNKYLDLSSYSSDGTGDDYDITFNTITNSSGELITPHIVFIKDTDSLIYREVINGVNRDVYLIRNGSIIASGLSGGHYYKLRDDLIATNVPERPIWYTLALIPYEEEEAYEIYETQDAYKQYFKTLTNRNEENGKKLKINQSGEYEYTLSPELGATEGEYIFETVEEFDQYFHDFVNKEELNNVIIQINRSGEYELFYSQLSETPSSFDLEYENLEALLKAFEDTEQAQRPTAFNNKTIHLTADDVYYSTRVIDKSIFRRVNVSDVPKYYLVGTYTASKPSCDIGIYSEISIEELVQRINDLEAGGSDAGVVDFYALEDSIYQITQVSVLNGGIGGYSVDDRIRCIFNNISSGDRRGEIRVTRVDNDGKVLACEISDPGFYLQNVSQNIVETINKDKDYEEANGLTLRVYATARASTNISSVPKSKNCRVQVTCDETHYNHGSIYVYNVPDGSSVEDGQWVYVKDVTNDYRDLSIDKVNLHNEVTGILSPKNGGIGVDASEIFETQNAKHLLGINESGKFTDITAIDCGTF